MVVRGGGCSSTLNAARGWDGSRGGGGGFEGGIGNLATLLRTYAEGSDRNPGRSGGLWVEGRQSRVQPHGAAVTGVT